MTGNIISPPARGIVADIPASLLQDKFPAGLLEELYAGQSLTPPAGLPGSDNLAVSGNTLRDCAEGGIEISGLDGRPLVNVCVTGNILSGADGEAGAAARDIRTAHCRNLTVSGNIAR